MEEYDLELEKVAREIKKNNYKSVCVQLPDGLKPKATQIADYIEKNTKAKVVIWLESCYGACDITSIDVDLLVQWGHSEWKK
ncbi:diphthamide synthesis protein [Candidatus Woesearchaeota archaeon]|nr:diphthamide synthesis protein [Candidatus Woesearchaeota archaeon]